MNLPPARTSQSGRRPLPWVATAVLGTGAVAVLALLARSPRLHAVELTSELSKEGAPAVDGPAVLETVLTADGDFTRSRPLKAWSQVELARLSSASSREKDPVTEKVSQWKGVLLSRLIDQSLAGLSPEQKSHIDLVVLANRAGEQALVPRSLVTKYPILLADQRDRKPLAAEQGPVQLVFPWTSRPKMAQEPVPLQRLFLAGVSRVELTSYRDRYQSLLLKVRRDPSALWGEKLFRQNCIACHAVGIGPKLTELTTEAKTRLLSTAGHPPAKGIPRLTPRDHRSLASYLDELRAESPDMAAAAAAPAAPAVTGPAAVSAQASPAPH